MGLVVSIGADISKFEREFNRSTKLIQGVANGLISVGSKLTASVTLPIVGIGAASVATAMDFDKSMSKVQAISGATGEDLDRLRSMAKEMGATTQFSAKESADALTYMGMAGWKTEDMLSGLPGVLNLAAAGGTDLALTADIVTDGLTSMGLTANDTGMFVDIMAATCSNSNTSVELMGETLKYCGSTAGALGINMGDLSLAIGLMGNAGIKGSQAGTALRGGLTRLAKPTSEVSSAMKKYGIQLKTTKDGSVDLNGTMEELRKKLGGVTEVQQASALASIFGKEAMAGWASIVNASEEDFNKLKEAIEGSNGTAENMAKVMNDNLAGAMTTLKSSTEGLLIAIGERLTPYIRIFAEKLTEVTSALSSMSDEQLDLVIKIGLVVAAIGPLLVILGGLISFGLKVVSVWGILSTAFTTVSTAAAAAGMSVAAFCAPVLIAIGVVVALAAAVVTNFGGIRDCISSVMSSVSSIIQSVLSFIKGLWESNFMGIKTYTIGVWNQIKLTFKTVFDAIRDIFNIFSKVFQGDWKGAWEAVKQLGVNLWNNIKSLFSNFLNTIVDTLLNIGVSLYTAARDAWDNVKRGAMEIWERVKAWFSQAVKDPIGTLKSIGSAMFNAGKDMINSVWDGCKSIWNSVKNWFSEKVNWIKDKLTFWKSSKAEMSDGDTRSRSALNQSAFNLQSSIVTANPIATRSSITRNNSITNNYNFYGNIGSNKNESFNVDKLAERLEFERRRASRATGGV